MNHDCEKHVSFILLKKKLTIIDGPETLWYQYDTL